MLIEGMTDRQQRRARRTYLAIFDGYAGYAIDCYPEELIGTRRDYGKQVLGEFATGQEAQKAVKERMDAECAILNARPHRRRRMSPATPVTVICPTCNYRYMHGVPGRRACMRRIMRAPCGSANRSPNHDLQLSTATCASTQRARAGCNASSIGAPWR